MILPVQIILLVTLPYGGAILIGALGERIGGKIVSAWASVAGLILGIYVLEKSMKLFT